MLLKEQITYHANFALTKKAVKKDKVINWFSIWVLESEKIQLDTGEYFTLDKAADHKAIFKDLTKMGYASRGSEYRAFKRIVKSHELDWILKGCSYSWQVIADVLTLIIANVSLDKRRKEALGHLIAIRYEEAEKQSQAIVYREFIDRNNVYICKKRPTMHHRAELMKEENRKRAIKAKSLRDVVPVTNHNADVLNDMADELARLRSRVAILEASQMDQLDNIEI